MKPITFVTEMVQRILAPAGEVAKTQTRRLAPTNIVPGDMLWVREAYRLPKKYDDLTPLQYLEATQDESIQVWYIADESEANPMPDWAGRYRHARFMPQGLSRLCLEVVDVREELLWEITEDDVIAEGIVGMIDENERKVWPNYHPFMKGQSWYLAAQDSYASLFYFLHPQLDDANPLLAVLSFGLKFQL